MGKPRRGSAAAAAAAAVFSTSQIEQMERLVAGEKKAGLLDTAFCHQLATKFNRSSSSGGGGGTTKPIQAHHVQEWFRGKLTDQKTEPTDHAPSDTGLSDNLRQPSPDAPQDADHKDKMPALDELEFEARSSRDYAWYDVGTFLAHRTSNGQVEVRVRYADFGADEDEWINVKKAIRVRSIPVESSECKELHVGDLVLCFREGSSEAVHYDAHIIRIERKLHDVRGCRCLFLIKYDHDETEETVPLSKLCRRPKF